MKEKTGRNRTAVIAPAEPKTCPCGCASFEHHFRAFKRNEKINEKINENMQNLRLISVIFAFKSSEMVLTWQVR